MTLRRDSLPSFLFLCFHLLVASNAVLGAPILQAINCSMSGSGNYTATDAYAANLKQFFAALPENTVSRNGGFIGSVGQKPDTVYGHAMCGANYSLADCSDCLTAAAASNADGLRNRCPGSRSALAIFDQCFVRYSDVSFLGTSKNGSKAARVAKIVGRIFGVVCLALLICNLYILRRQRNAKDARRFSYPELAKATSNFAADKKLGAGAFGTVYIGKLNGMDVVIKEISMPDNNAEQGQVRKDFDNEIDFMSPLHHCNIISLVGFCKDNTNLLLVYELMENGNLEDQLYPKAGSMDSHLHGVTVPGTSLLLDWPKRNHILIGVATGLVYLHSECKEPLLHGDIKPRNVMLDKSFNAKLCDFALVKEVSNSKTSLSADNIRGTTKGYVDPAYADTGRACEQNDVYSFGIVLLEVVCSERPTVTQNGDQIWNSLVEKVRACHQRNAILDAADGWLRGRSDEQLRRVLMIGLLCVQPDPHQRPRTRKVMEYLTNQAVPLPSVPTTDYTLPRMNESRPYTHSRRDEDAGTAAFLTSQC